MKYDADCLTCLVDHQFSLAPGGANDPKKLAYMREVLRILLDAPANVAAPYFIPLFSEAYQRFFGASDPYEAQKDEANRTALQELENLEAYVFSADDSLYRALQVSLLGNFLDFAVLDAETVREELQKALCDLSAKPINAQEYQHFCQDLETAGSMLIIGDNAGEIVFDTVLVKTLLKINPKLHLSYVVRGGIAQNDATRADASISGMDKLVPILDTGSTIPGVQLEYCSQAFLDAFHAADIVLAKGQGNYETLMGCGANVYYLLLCKCPRLAEILRLPRMTGVFCNEHRV